MIIPFTVQVTMMIILWFLTSPNVGSSHTKQMTVLNKIVAIGTIRIRPRLFRILSRRSTVNHVVPLLAVYQVVAVMVIVSNHQEASPVCVTCHGPKIKWAAVSPENKNFIPITATFKINYEPKNFPHRHFLLKFQIDMITRVVRCFTGANCLSIGSPNPWSLPIEAASGLWEGLLN